MDRSRGGEHHFSGLVEAPEMCCCPSLCEFRCKGLPTCRSAREGGEGLPRLAQDFIRSPLRPAHQSRIEEAHALVMTVTSLAVPFGEIRERRNALD